MGEGSQMTRSSVLNLERTQPMAFPMLGEGRGQYESLVQREDQVAGRQK